MYESTMTSLRTSQGLSVKFSITVGLHQGYALSPYIFALIIDQLTRHIQDEFRGSCYLHMSLCWWMRLVNESMLSWNNGRRY